METVRAMTGGQNYARNHLSNNDYYSVGETIEGRWMGRGAELLGLEGKVDLEHFEAMRQGNDPFSGEFLRQRHSADRMIEREVDGQTITESLKARNLYDVVLSAPKAMSVLALEDERVVQVHLDAADAAFQVMEDAAGARIRKGGANENRITSNLVVARYDHDTSRELDPQLHTHFVTGNLTFDGVEGRWKALQASEIYAQVEFGTEAYRNAAARGMSKLGYVVEDRFEHGKDLGFTIAGVAESTLEKFSQRSAQRDQAIQEFLAENGRLPSKNEVAILVRETRDPKLTEISTAEVKARQWSRLDPEEVRTLQALHQQALERGSVHEYAPAGPSLAYAREHVFERVSVAKDYELKIEALRHGRGKVELSELKGALQGEILSGAMLTGRGEVATKESLDRERRMVATINEGIGKYEALARREFLVSDRLRPEQRTAVLAVLDSRDLAVNLRGAAGTGKTATLQELHRGLEESRRSAVAIAPTASAVEELQKVGFKDAMTVARLLADSQQQQQLAGQVLIVDEAGMVASKDMSELLGLAKSKGARIVFSGDTAQIKSVSEGDALRVLERESNLKSVSLLQVQRQTNAEYKVAVETLRSHPAEGYGKLEAMGAIREVDWRIRAHEVSQAYREATLVPNIRGEARSVLVVAATHDEIKSVTHAIRQDRKLHGEIKAGETLTQHSPLNWTEAQKKQTKNYRPGQVLEFHKQVKGVGKNETLEVVSADQSGVIARKADGSTLTLTRRQAQAFAVFEKQEIEVSAGDKLLLQANWRDKNFKATNGELVTAARVQDGRIQLEDGRQLPAAYRQFTHGYAVTAHRSQGKTVDYEIIAAERMAQDLFYVSVTRAREGVTVITSDSLALLESIGVSGDRQSAIELAKRATAKVFEPAFSKVEDLFRAYQEHRAQRTQELQIAFRQTHSAQIVPTEKEITQHVNSHSSGIGVGF